MHPVEAINTGLLTLLYWKRMMRACCELGLYEMDWRLASYTTNVQTISITRTRLKIPWKLKEEIGLVSRAHLWYTCFTLWCYCFDKARATINTQCLCVPCERRVTGLGDYCLNADLQHVSRLLLDCAPWETVSFRV